MKRMTACLLAALFLLSGCGGESGASLIARVRREKSLLYACAQEMRALGYERVYAALEAPEETKETEKESGAAAFVPSGEKRLVIYQKASDEHMEKENETLQEVLLNFNFALILFQTASDGRESVVFSTGAETDAALLRGVTFSFDGEAVGFWGRRADLKKHKGRYVEINENGAAWFYTIPLEDNFWYWEKSGALLG